MGDAREPDLHDTGGDIGRGDTTAGRGDPDRPRPQVDPAAMAVDSVPDQVRVGANADETEVVQQGEEIHPVPGDEEQ